MIIQDSARKQAASFASPTRARAHSPHSLPQARFSTIRFDSTRCHQPAGTPIDFSREPCFPSIPHREALTWVYPLRSIFKGCGWIYLDLPGFTWIHLDSPGFTWIYLDLLGFTWIYLDLLGFAPIFRDSLGFRHPFDHLMFSSRLSAMPDFLSHRMLDFVFRPNSGSERPSHGTQRFTGFKLKKRSRMAAKRR